MKKLGGLALWGVMVLVLGCNSADSSGPPNRPQPGPNRSASGPSEYPGPGWCIAVRQGAFSADNRFVLVAYDGDSQSNPLGEMMPVYDLSNGQRVHTFWRKDLTSFLAIPGTAHILAFNPDGELKVWDMTNGKLVRSVGKFSKGTSLGVISKDGNRIFFGSEEVVQVWDIDKGKCIYRCALEDSLGGLLFSPDGKWLFTRNPKKRKYLAWDVATGKEVPLPADQEEWKKWAYPLGQYPLAFSPDGKLAVSEHWNGKKSQMVLWDWTTGKIVRKLDCEAEGRTPGASAGTKAIAFSADGKRLISAGNDMMLRSWDIPTGQEIWATDIEKDNKQPPVRGIKAAIFSTDGRRALTSYGAWCEEPRRGGQKDLRLRVWDCTNGKQLRRLPTMPDGSREWSDGQRRYNKLLLDKPWGGGRRVPLRV